MIVIAELLLMKKQVKSVAQCRLFYKLAISDLIQTEKASKRGL